METVSRDLARQIKREASGRIEDFYAQRSWQPLWIQNDTLSPAASEFLGLIDTADADGLDARDYDPDDLRELIARARSGEPKALARAEVRLSREFAHYVRDTRQPRMGIRYLDPELEPRSLKEDEVLSRAALAGSFPDYVTQMGWMSPFYGAVRQEIRRYRADLSDGAPITIPAGPVLRQGMSGERVQLLRQRLGVEPGDQFDLALSAALARFQQQHGIAADSVVGPRTLAVLNGGRNYLPVLRLNLERARLLPDSWTRHVVVNTAGAQLFYYGNGQQEGAMKVVVGKSGSPTPPMAGMIRYATLNPYWNVPVEIVQQSLAPRILKGESLGSMGYEALSDWTRDAHVIDPKTVDWKAVAAGKVELRVRQLPGGSNAMGDVKFTFPNDDGIYLHDTPSRQLFDEDARQFSHGCIRLEDAPRLGEWFFGRPLQRKSGDPEQYLALPDPVPVFITYLTAVPNGDSIAYLDDVYKQDSVQLAQFAAR